MGVDPEDPRLNPYGGAIACGHPLAATGVRLLAQLAYGFRERPDVRYGLTALCVGMGMGAALLWETVKPPVRVTGPGEGARRNREVPPARASDAGH
jgi:acetyl-CoA acyltransferase